MGGGGYSRCVRPGERMPFRLALPACEHLAPGRRTLRAGRFDRGVSVDRPAQCTQRLLADAEPAGCTSPGSSVFVLTQGSTIAATCTSEIGAPSPTGEQFAARPVHPQRQPQLDGREVVGVLDSTRQRPGTSVRSSSPRLASDPRRLAWKGRAARRSAPLAALLRPSQTPPRHTRSSVTSGQRSARTSAASRPSRASSL